MFVLEARNANDRIVGRAEYDDPKWTKRFVREFENRDIVQSIRITDKEVEIFKWER